MAKRNLEAEERLRGELERLAPLAVQTIEGILLYEKASKARLDAVSQVLDRLIPKAARVEIEDEHVVRVVLSSETVSVMKQALAESRSVPVEVIEGEYELIESQPSEEKGVVSGDRQTAKNGGLESKTPS